MPRLIANKRIVYPRGKPDAREYKPGEEFDCPEERIAKTLTLARICSLAPERPKVEEPPPPRRAARAAPPPAPPPAPVAPLTSTVDVDEQPPTYRRRDMRPEE